MDGYAEPRRASEAKGLDYLAELKATINDACQLLTGRTSGFKPHHRGCYWQLKSLRKEHHVSKLCFQRVTLALNTKRKKFCKEAYDLLIKELEQGGSHR